MITAQSKSKPEQDSAYVFDRCRITADPKVEPSISAAPGEPTPP